MLGRSTQALVVRQGGTLRCRPHPHTALPPLRLSPPHHQRLLRPIYPSHCPRRRLSLTRQIEPCAARERDTHTQRHQASSSKRRKHGTLKEKPARTGPDRSQAAAAATAAAAAAEERERERESSIYGDALCLPVAGSRPPPLLPHLPLLPLLPSLLGRGGGGASASSAAAARDERREVGGQAGALHGGAVRGAGAAGAHLQVPRRRRPRPAGSPPPHPPRLRVPRLALLPPPRPWVRVLLRQEAGSGAGAVPADGRQEVAVLQGGRPGLQVLRAPHAPRPQPFKKACGNAARRPLPLPAARPRRHRRVPQPLAVSGDRHWRWRGWLLRLGVRSAAHGQCCAVRDRWCRRKQRFQVFCVWSENVGDGGAQPVHQRSHGHRHGQLLVAPDAAPGLGILTLELPHAGHAERPGPERDLLAGQDGEGAAVLLRRLRRRRLRRRLGGGEAGEPDAAALLRRVAQGQGLVAGAAEPRRQQQQQCLLGHQAVHLHPGDQLRLLRHHRRLPLAQRYILPVKGVGRSDLC